MSSKINQDGGSLKSCLVMYITSSYLDKILVPLDNWAPSASPGSWGVDCIPIVGHLVILNYGHRGTLALWYANQTFKQKKTFNQKMSGLQVCCRLQAVSLSAQE